MIQRRGDQTDRHWLKLSLLQRKEGENQDCIVFEYLGYIANFAAVGKSSVVDKHCKQIKRLSKRSNNSGGYLSSSCFLPALGVLGIAGLFGIDRTFCAMISDLYCAK